MMRTKFKVLVPALFLYNAIGCRSVPTPQKVTTAEIIGRSQGLSWQELVVDDSELFQPNPGAAFLRENIDASISRLPADLRANKKLAQLVINRFMDKTLSFHGGALGKVGDTSVFVAERRMVPDFDSLHLVIINTLSSRYGCLMRQRRKVGDFQELVCRDGRKIEITRKQGEDWIQFVANQFDQNGAAIVVRNHEIIKR